MSEAEKVDVEVVGGSELGATVSKGAGLLILVGVIEIILGMFAVILPMAVSLAIGSLIGVLFMLSGIAQIITSHQRAKGLFNGSTIFSLLYLLVGFVLLVQPESAAKMITLLLGIFFIVGGVLRFLEALSSHFSGSAKMFVFFNAIITFALGWMIVAQWPGDAAWVLGLLIGINLLFNGWTALFMGITLKNRVNNAS